MTYSAEQALAVALFNSGAPDRGDLRGATVLATQVVAALRQMGWELRDRPAAAVTCEITDCGLDAILVRRVKVQVAALVVDADLALCARHGALVDGAPVAGSSPTDLDLPFEETEGTLAVPDELACGVVMMGCAVPVPGEPRPWPGVIFRFQRPDGVMYPPRLLVMVAEQLERLPVLARDAANGAVRVSRRPPRPVDPPRPDHRPYA